MKSLSHEFRGCDVHDAIRNGESREAAFEAIRRRELAQIEKLGWCAHLVTGDPESPTGFNCHSHGFAENLGHPDFQIVLPIPNGDAHQVLINLSLLVKEGRRFAPGSECDELLDGHVVAFVEAVENGRPLLRIVFPDANGKVSRDDIAEPFAIQYEGTHP